MLISRWTWVLLLFLGIIAVLFLAVIVRVVIRGSKRPCPDCGGRDFDKGGRCVQCGGRAGQGFEVIPTSKDQ